jgi:NO-binding membrane sensor protein with MHYT domain
VSPPLLLGLTIATLYGCGCHALFGRRLWQWPLFWASALVGFFAGFAAGVGLGMEWVRLGSIPLLVSTIGALVGLWLCWFFTSPYAVSGTDSGLDR